MCIKKSRKFYLPTIKDEEPKKKHFPKMESASSEP
ncbi:hypothetical protein P7362_14770 [Staphylococcus aureus]|nr:hypothetical protein [Staphylococcus aureus]MDM5543355.1 hypothetical protein [Staphylococcus aureus]